MIVERVLPNATLLALLVAALPVHAQQDTPTIQQLEQQLRDQQKLLENTRQSLERLKIRMQVPGGPAQGPVDYQPGGPGASQEAVGQAPPHPQETEAAKVAPILDQPGILTPRGRFAFEPSLQYDYSSNSQVNLIGFSVLPAILVGLIDVRQVDTTTVTAAASLRYGLTNRLELNAKVPYVYGHQSAITRPFAEGAANEQVFTNSGRGIGDVQLGARYQFNDGGLNTPYFIGSLTASLPTGKGPFDIDYSVAGSSPTGLPVPEEQPTGSGFYAYDVGVLAIYPSDPVVFFGGLNYTWRPSKDVDKTIGGMRIGKVNPGDSIKMNFGMGMSLNEKSSLSLGYQHTYVRPTTYDGNSAADSTSIQVGQLLIGYGYQLTPSTNINLTLGVGVTRYAPNAELLLRIPMTF
ncbi:MAG: transporter [Castellaniella sp.]|uniref:transporter n=1 Tax=Castellaniella sp. TaxID=1955812 RepID=UPI003C755870